MSIPEREEEILKSWKDQQTFEKTLVKESTAGEFVFYDGPPFATGLPHYGHLLPGTIKDLIPRYKTMRGYHVSRQWGWDCHGLPVEYETEKDLKISGKRDIEEKVGLAKFNDACRSIVLRYTTEWEESIARTGRWVDMRSPYRTMDASFMESIWWVFSTLHKDKKIFKGNKVLPYCPRCATPLSNFEVNQPGAYRDTQDPAVFVKFKLADPKFSVPTYLVAWTTTPWTLPANMALAVGADIVYAEIVANGEHFIVAKERLSMFPGEHEIVAQHKGSELAGLSYEPLFPYFKDKAADGAFTVHAADFVSTEDGTGVVHIAPAFGEDDFKLAMANRIPLVDTLDGNGHFTKSVPDYAGKFFKAADKLIMEALGDKLVHTSTTVHSYPHCWRCDSPLLYKAIDTWFVRVSDMRGDLIKANNDINWVPKHVGTGRFGKWIAEARDWAISRNRYWGTPLPVWQCTSCDHVESIGSVETLLTKATKRNRFILVRHGEAESNKRSVVNTVLETSANYPLTEHGKKQLAATAKELKQYPVTKIIASPFARAQETAKMLNEELGVAFETHHQWGEIGAMDFDGKPEGEYLALFADEAERMTRKIGQNETMVEVATRVMNTLKEIDAAHDGETIVIVSHGDPLRLALWGMSGKTKRGILDVAEPATASVTELPVVGALINHGELNLHRPAIDAVVWPCPKACGGEMRRIEEVLDCWFESGAMPYASKHYPFEDKAGFEKHRFPGEFIAEGVDQTRGWFYTMLVLGVALFGKSSFKNCVVSGLILAEDGRKMSKRLKNYPELSEIVGKYGADALRMYLLNSAAVEADEVRFADRGVGDVSRQLMTLGNVCTFYTTYAPNSHVTELPKKLEHPLDQWILAKLHSLTLGVTEALDTYEVRTAAMLFAPFINEFSTWYLRRSRDRFKEKGADQEAALAVTRHVLLVTAKLLAPFTPFVAEHIYREVGGELESVHLADWPTLEKKHANTEIVQAMDLARAMVETAHSLRAEHAMKVRQPLAALAIAGARLPENLLEILADEVNVQDVTIEKTVPPAWPQKTIGAVTVALDIKLTSELAELGLLRELSRQVNDVRKKAGLTPQDRVAIAMETENEHIKTVAEKYNAELMKATLATTVTVGTPTRADFSLATEVDGTTLTVSITK